MGRTPQGSNQNNNLVYLVMELRSEVDKLKQEVEKLKAPATIVACLLCEDGIQLDADGQKVTDDLSNLPVVCPKCDGTGQRRI